MITKNLIVSSLLPPNMVKELAVLGVNCINAGKSTNINNETAYHTDMLFFRLNNGELLVEKEFQFVHNLETFIKIKESKGKLGPIYPLDCRFNCLYAGSNLICGKSVADEILEDAKVCGFNIEIVKQGYVACSTIKIKDNAYITADFGISKVLQQLGFDVLTVSNNGIDLDGYGNGFIGGCNVYSDKEIVAFSGAIEKHIDYADIKSFCRNHGVAPYSLSLDRLYDYGGGLII